MCRANIHISANARWWIIDKDRLCPWSNLDIWSITYYMVHIYCLYRFVSLEIPGDYFTRQLAIHITLCLTVGSTVKPMTHWRVLGVINCIFMSCLCQVFSLIFSFSAGFGVRDNLITPEPIVFKFMSVRITVTCTLGCWGVCPPLSTHTLNDALFRTIIYNTEIF